MADKIENNYVFDEELADWLKKAFPKKVNSNVIAQWRNRGKMPKWCYHYSINEIYELPINFYLLYENKSAVEVAKDIGERGRYMYGIFAGDIEMPKRVENKLKNYYAKYENKKIILPRLPIKIEKNFVLEYEEVEKVHLVAGHSFYTRNGGVAYTVFSIFPKEERFERDCKKILGKKLSEILETGLFSLAKTENELKREVKKSNVKFFNQLKKVIK